MKKKYVVIVLIALVLFAIAIYFFTTYNDVSYNSVGNCDESGENYLNELNKNCSEFISNEEIAQNFGYILLKEAFPNYFKKNKNIELEAIRMDPVGYEGVWKVFIANQFEKKGFFNKKVISLGGNFYVLFKTDGTILEFGISA